MDLLARGCAVARAIKTTRTQGGQITAPEVGIWNQVGGRCSASMRTNTLVVSEEEQLVFDDWAADAAPEFIVSKWVLPLRGIFEEIPGIKLLIAVVFVRRTVKDVGAALADRD